MNGVVVCRQHGEMWVGEASARAHMHIHARSRACVRACLRPHATRGVDKGLGWVSAGYTTGRQSAPPSSRAVEPAGRRAVRLLAHVAALRHPSRQCSRHLAAALILTLLPHAHTRTHMHPAGRHARHRPGRCAACGRDAADRGGASGGGGGGGGAGGGGARPQGREGADQPGGAGARTCLETRARARAYGRARVVEGARAAGRGMHCCARARMVACAHARLRALVHGAGRACGHAAVQVEMSAAACACRHQSVHPRPCPRDPCSPGSPALARLLLPHAQPTASRPNRQLPNAAQDPEVAAAVAELKARKDAQAALKQRWDEMVGSTMESLDDEEE